MPSPRKILFFILAISALNFATHNAHAINLVGRVGMGMSNQLVGDLTALSFKVQKSASTAYGALIAVDGDDDAVDYGIGLKVYQILFDEPNLSFYAAALAAVLNVNDESGYQIDGTMGSEFHIPGVESIGLSFEFGISINKLGDTRHIETAGYNFLKAAIHFYL